MNRPEPVEAYLLNELPDGARYRYNAKDCDDHTYTKRADQRYTEPLVVLVVEWPQRTYDGIPADELDRIVAWVNGKSFEWNDIHAAADRIRAAIAAQEQDQ